MFSVVWIEDKKDVVKGFSDGLISNRYFPQSRYYQLKVLIKSKKEGLEAGIRARDAALEAFASAACRAVLDGAAPVAAPIPMAVRAMGQRRLAA